MLIFVVVAGCVYLGTDKNRIKTYHDVNIYMEKTYFETKELGEKVYHTGINSKQFIPSYNDLSYHYSSIDFYIFDGTATLTDTAVTIALDLFFDDENVYATAKQTAMESNFFMSESEKAENISSSQLDFTIEDFECKTVEDDGFSRRFGLLCFSDEKRILRYLYFEEWESPEYLKSKNYIWECSNCPWEVDE